MTPLQRFFSLLKLDKKDVYQIFFYATFAGLISLSLPLGIQAIINFIQSGRVSASWIVLIIGVVVGVAFVGILALMQLRITENLQQKIFVRSSFEFAYRLPKIRFEERYNEVYPPELANRFFDTLTIQKGISKLLLDFSSALLQIGFGIILLSLYHPFFILFGLLLVALLYLIFKFSYKPGLETSMKESKFKYGVATWLQEIARNHSSFRKNLNFDYALQKNNGLVEGYLAYREKHFNVIKRQFSQLIIFKIIITAGLLFIGGYLVISQKMNIGQFVASEIIILLVINSVEKIIIGLETFYDVLTSVEKIGQVTDMDMEDWGPDQKDSCFSTIILEAENIRFKFPDSKNDVLKNISLKISQGEKIAITGKNGSGKTTLIRILSGTLIPGNGSLSINDDTFRKINLAEYRSQIGCFIQGETPFEGSILENITFNNPEISQSDLKWVLDAVHLSPYIKTLPEGLDTMIFPDGRQLTSSNAQKILLARCLISRPRILFLEDPTDKMDEAAAHAIIDFICDPKNRWTVVVSSPSAYWQEKANRHIIMEKGRIINDTNRYTNA
ncbi:MAG: ABC transporter ATP-binding protein/permease [Flavobacterium sp. BFFFF1]|uniref:peptidase domain-containing ABC transporter n=1 Tax=unclassified Flavobacterium TaxID=196869 RepID=UPI000BC5CF35|nr:MULTISPECIES: ATP-binding cassette domain-containing protein [unclassified Flavobacterium]OYU79710.1 MAG: ABC transporter ATP-binding protein/permease [Flavobacterium sp. BFFFF1]